MTNRERLLALRTANPNMKAADVARELGISPERVRQLCNSLHLPTAIPDLTKVTCPVCGGPKKRFQNQCFGCKEGRLWVKLECQVCHRTFKRRAYQYRRNQKVGSTITVCSRQCLGSHLGKTYGWAHHKKTPAQPKRIHYPLIPEVLDPYWRRQLDALSDTIYGRIEVPTGGERLG